MPPGGEITLNNVSNTLSIDNNDLEKDITFTVRQDVDGGELPFPGKTLRITVIMKIRCGTTNEVMESVDIVDPNTIKFFFAPNLIQKYEFQPFKCLFPVCCTQISYFAVDENLSQINHQNLT